MNIIKYIGTQFANPRGIGGLISTFFMNLLNKSQYRCVRKLILKYNPNAVLDIGFGNGYLLKQLSSESNADFYGIDISDDMIKQATKRNNKKIQAGKMTLDKGSVSKLNYHNDFLDYIYTVNTVYFWEDLRQGYSEVFRVLKEGGTFANIFYSKEWLDKLRYTKYDFKKYDPEELENEVLKLEFKKVKLIEIKKDCAYCLLVKR
jgi:ubiquinone/menaquinone biosynthesis C-methylase UbiE